MTRTATIQTQYINCDPASMPRDLYLDHDGKVVSIEHGGTYEHPQHPGVADWCVNLWTITLPDGRTCGAVSNNAITYYEDDASFAETIEEYGIN